MSLGAFPERNLAIVEMYRAGDRLADISDAFAISWQRVQQIAWRAGEPRRLPIAREVRVCPVCGAKHERRPLDPVIHCSRQCGSRYGGGPQTYTDTVLIALLSDLGKRLGRTPNSHDMNADTDTASQTTYVNRFGSVRAAQIAAGFTPNAPGAPGHAKATEER